MTDVFLSMFHRVLMFDQEKQALKAKSSSSAAAVAVEDEDSDEDTEDLLSVNWRSKSCF